MLCSLVTSIVIFIRSISPSNLDFNSYIIGLSRITVNETDNPNIDCADVIHIHGFVVCSVDVINTHEP